MLLNNNINCVNYISDIPVLAQMLTNVPILHQTIAMRTLSASTHLVHSRVPVMLAMMGMERLAQVCLLKYLLLFVRYKNGIYQFYHDI